ncbi:MAG TPA: LPS-assembly protein LptD, partial [Sedimenticola sp.]|nr:LPS-assembly protein LptD [Sedimenticola sp.]
EQEPGPVSQASGPPGTTHPDNTRKSGIQTPAPEKRQPPASSGTETAAAEAAVARLDQGLEARRCGIPDTPAPLSFEPAPADTLVIDADDSEFQEQQQRALFTGQVDVRRDSQRLVADQVDYNKAADTLDAKGNVYFEKPGVRLATPAAHVDLQSGEIAARDVEYRLTDRNGRGHAASVVIENADLSKYQDINYTTCPPGQDDWLLRADRLEVNRATGKGVARNASLSFQGVPFLYTPYASFPIDDRRMTGFLAPSFGQSNTLGTVVSIPYYLNIAPQADATITPRIMSKRGLMLEGEARYLGERHRQTFLGQIVPDDRDAAEGVDSTRGGFSWKTSGTAAPHLTFDTNINYVSDKDYLADFSRNLIWSSTKNLERRADLKYNGQGWWLRGRLQHYQSVDPTVKNSNKPYSRLPQLLLQANRPGQLLGLTYHLRSEYAYFKQPARDMVEGSRIDLQPGISLPLRRSWGYIVPKASMKYTAYSLTDEAPGTDDTPDRTLPIASVDSGLVFERAGDWFGSHATQTLEPRLFYLYIPNKNQKALPDFDTADVDFSMASLFRENRFNGQDRVGDANQLTTALTTRTLDRDSGVELFRGSIGQIFYFRDRKVQLDPDDPPDTDSSSAWVAEATARLSGKLRTRGNIQYNAHRNRTEKGAASLHYQDAQERILNLGYRYDEDDFEKIDISGRWPLTAGLHTVGHWNYSLKYSDTMSLFAGFEYETCCWIGRFIAQQLLTDPDGKKKRVNSVMLQLELKGLTSIGSKIDDFLEEGVLGYEAD